MATLISIRWWTTVKFEDIANIKYCLKFAPHDCRERNNKLRQGGENPVRSPVGPEPDLVAAVLAVKPDNDLDVETVREDEENCSKFH